MAVDLDDYDPSDFEFAVCQVCGAEMVRESCWHCMGEGGFHDCGDDCCPCLYKDVLHVRCDECNGEGWYLACSALPHSQERMAEYRKAQWLKQQAGEQIGQP